MIEEKKTIDFNAIKLTLASPQQIQGWSHGEVLKPETINYRTQKPEKDGLFCERIFGPTKDWECYCGKYKKIRYKGVVCDKCGVEVTRSSVRRERMGHINLASPCSHIWFLRGIPSKIGLILNISPQNLEKVIYFANFIITDINEDLKMEVSKQIKQEFKIKKKKIESDFDRQISLIKGELTKKNPGLKAGELEKLIEEKIINLNDSKKEKIAELEQILQAAEGELKELKPLKIITEHTYQDLSLKYGHIFEAGIGAEAIRKLLQKIDLEKSINKLKQQLIDTTTGIQKEKLLKQLKLTKNLIKNKIRPEWMILATVPVIPPDLRPMVPLDGGRFATSDLNDLYRRIINRNNRLKQLIELNAPEVICRNEKRMLQEAVDALIDNSARHGKTVTASTGQKRMLKSLADILRGKQGRFRQNLLGKRIDYSGRSVIIVGPKLKINQCGLPKRMALELFKPMVISRLIKGEYVHNVRSANRFIESDRPEVWDILEEVVKNAYVLLNRAPTLHRLGIQAFQPKLIEGKAIQIHPLVCAAFNADFDGDQMAVHVPLTEQAKMEAAELMNAKKNLLKPATGDPIANPTKDMVWGSYYMTSITDSEKNDFKKFSSFAEAILAYQLGKIKLQEKIGVKKEELKDKSLEGKAPAKNSSTAIFETSVGRIIFNQILPEDSPFLNKTIDNKAIKDLISVCLEKKDAEFVAELQDKIKDVSLTYLTKSGYSWGIDDVPKIKNKEKIITEGEKKVEEIENQYNSGLLTESERHSKIIECWMQTKEKVVKESRDSLDPAGPVYTMVESGARGSWSQLIQIVGMKGLVTNPAGEIIELPVKGNFKEGFDVLEFFISTHGARKGLSDTALRTANAGYLTRRLVDVSQDMVIREHDCGDTVGIVINKKDREEIGIGLAPRIKGRFSLEKIIHPKTKKVMVEKNELITNPKAQELEKLDIPEIKVRSVINCKTLKGVCQKCYGYDLAYNKLVELGTAVGIIAAQSIGEPGTQLTMRTFHTGGVVGLDITQGLPRVEEIFEARTPKNRAFISEVNGKVKIDTTSASRKSSNYKLIKIQYEERETDNYLLKEPIQKNKKLKKEGDLKIKVKNQSYVKKGEVLFINEFKEKVLAKRSGLIKLGKEAITVEASEIKTKEYQISSQFHILVKDGDLISKGDALTDGHLDLKTFYRLKGRTETQKYIVKEIQQIYFSQGQKLNDKHIELITKQMFSRVYIKDPGDTDFLTGERIELSELEKINQEIKKKGRQPASGEKLLLGITKVSLSTSSFLSAASFQETARVLINAAIEGRIDHLEGLKENVIIGRLIPAGTGYKKE